MTHLIPGDAVAFTDKQYIRKMMVRFNVPELHKAMDGWGVVAHDLAKRDVIQLIMKARFESGMSYSDYADLDVLFTQLRPTSKRWTSLELIPFSDHSFDDAPVDSSPAEVVRKFTEHLSRFAMVYTKATSFSGATWIKYVLSEGVLSVDEASKIGSLAEGRAARRSGELPVSASGIVVYYPKASHVFVSSRLKEYHPFVMSAIAVATGSASVHHAGLSGSHVESLANMMLFQASQGAFAKYRQGSDESKAVAGPLDRRAGAAKRQRPGVAEALERAEQDARDDAEAPRKLLVTEDRAQRNELRDAAERAFGREGDAPTLDTFTFNCNTALDNLGIVPMTVKMRGRAVIAGLRTAQDAGLLMQPIPRHLAQLASLGKNVVSVPLDTDDKAKAGRNMHTSAVAHVDTTALKVPEGTANRVYTKSRAWPAAGGRARSPPGSPAKALGVAASTMRERRSSSGAGQSSLPPATATPSPARSSRRSSAGGSASLASPTSPDVADDDVVLLKL
uniref:Uncharacterized protein n=1 Tax=Sexangularia sp. CB-2014 TaxID=1486929 RepID=A0A6U0IAC4_9EUKA